MSSSRCAACKYLRRKCPSDCVFAPYFPSNNPQRFACVHKIFGASNIGKMLKQLPVHQRAEAADALHFEAQLRVQDPIYGSVGMISFLQQKINSTQHQLAETRAQIALSAQADHQVHTQRETLSDHDEFQQVGVPTHTVFNNVFQELPSVDQLLFDPSILEPPGLL